jgi:hypothetical protein
VRGRIPVRGILFLSLIVAVGGQALALHSTGTHSTRHRTHRRRFRNILYHPMFRPTRESLLRQNEEIDRLELPRIQDDAELEELESTGALVPIHESEALRFDPRLKPNRRYCRPWTRDFLVDLSQAFYAEFHRQIQVNSAVRTAQQQKKLRRHNRNAAPDSGETGSSHLAGITVDIQRRGLTREQIRWIEEYMLPLRDQDLIEPEEERHQWVFHVMVSNRYEGWRDVEVLDAKQQSAPATEPAVLETLQPPPLSIIAQQP